MSCVNRQLEFGFRFQHYTFSDSQCSTIECIERYNNNKARLWTPVVAGGTENEPIAQPLMVTIALSLKI